VGMRRNMTQSLTGWSVQSGETVRCDDSDMDPRVNVEVRARVGARSLIVVPLYREGRVVGVLNVVAPQAHAFDDTDVQTLQLMAGFIAGALRHAADFEAMRTLIAERTAALAALQESEAHMGAILDASPDATVIADSDGHIVRVNAQAERLFGYTREAFLGQRVELLLPERLRRAYLQHRASYLVAPQPRRMGERLDLYAQRKDGHEVPVAIGGSLDCQPGTRYWRQPKLRAESL